MSSVAIIACDHGLGHVRRCVLTAEALHAEGATVTLLAPDGAPARVRRALGLPAPSDAASGTASDAASGVRDVAFATLTSPEALRVGDPAATRWEERLPDLDRFDQVVADTVPEVLAVRPDAVIVAQFLWHDVLDGFDPGARERAEALLAEAGTVIGSEPFAMPAVRALRRFRPVGLHLARVPDPSRTAGTDLLIAGGTTPALHGPLRALVAELLARSTAVGAAGGPGPFRAVHVDRALLPSTPPAGTRPDWLQEAVHTPALYDGLAAALIRPGLGTLTELLARGVTVHSVYEAGNAELAHNAQVIASLGGPHLGGPDLGDPDLGVPPTDPAAVDGWVRSVLDRVFDGAAAVGAAASGPVEASLRFDGAAQTARIVLGREHAG